VDAFDSDVLIYAIVIGHPNGERVADLFAADDRGDPGIVGVGSPLLLPELLTKPVRDGAHDEVAELNQLLARLDLRPVDTTIAEMSVTLGARYRLTAADAIHLATALQAGADRFITNNRGDFPKTITEVTITYPDEV